MLSCSDSEKVESHRIILYDKASGPPSRVLIRMLFSLFPYASSRLPVSDCGLYRATFGKKSYDSRPAALPRYAWSVAYLIFLMTLGSVAFSHLKQPSHFHASTFSLPSFSCHVLRVLGQLPCAPVPATWPYSLFSLVFCLDCCACH